MAAQLAQCCQRRARVEAADERQRRVVRGRLNRGARLLLQRRIVVKPPAARRLGGRLACKCGLSYHVEFNKSEKEGICNKCGDELFKRDDDEPEAIKKRLEIYHQETKPLFDFFGDQGKLFLIDGAKSIEEVYKQIDKTILDNNKQVK